MRYQKIVKNNGTETARYDYVYSDGKLILLTHTANGVANTARFIYDSFGEPRGFILNNSASYLYLKNGQGDITAIVDENGEILVRYTYNAWGAVEFIVPFGIDPAVTTVLATVSPFTYRGYCYDFDLGLYYLQSRYYDPEICRFINADSTDYLGATGTLLSYNLFAYCENDGVNYTDYVGKFKMNDHYTLTYGVAIEYFKYTYAKILADMAKGVDEMYPPVLKFYSKYNQSFHFNVNSSNTKAMDSRDERCEEFIKKGVDVLKTLNKNSTYKEKERAVIVATTFFGIAIHPKQDKIAHSGPLGNMKKTVRINGWLKVSFYYHSPFGIDDVNGKYLSTGKTKGSVAKTETRSLLKRFIGYYNEYKVADYVRAYKI